MLRRDKTDKADELELELDLYFFEMKDNNEAAKAMLQNGKTKTFVGTMKLETGQVFLAPLLPDNILILHSRMDPKSTYSIYQLKTKDSAYDLCPEDVFDNVASGKNYKCQKQFLGQEASDLIKLMHQEGYLPTAKGFKNMYDRHSHLYQFHLAPSLLLDRHTGSQIIPIRNQRNSTWLAFEASYSEEHLQWKVRFNSANEQNPDCSFMRVGSKDQASLERHMEKEFKKLMTASLVQQQEVQADVPKLPVVAQDEVVGPGGDSPRHSPRH